MSGELFQVDRQTDGRRTDMTKLRVAFRKLTNAPKNSGDINANRGNWNPLKIIRKKSLSNVTGKYEIKEPQKIAVML
jgi:hypothetical protein